MIMDTQAGPLDSGLVRALIAELGDDAVVTDPDALIVYETDGLTAHRVRPRALLLPASTEEVAAAVKLLNHANVPYVPRGAGTGLSGGAIALEGAIVLSLARMTRILAIDVADRRATVEPGVTNARLSAATRPFGLYYAPDPSSQSVCTIGGNVAENAGGPHCLKYGTTVHHIIRLRVVLPDGAVVDLDGGGATYGLLGLFVGSEGTFGTATEVTTRLLPLPEQVETLLAQFATIDGATNAVSTIIASGLLPAALEMVDREATIAVEASVYAAGLSTDAAASLVIEFDGPEAGLSDDAERAAAICRAMGATELADMAAGLDHGECDLATARGVVHDPDPALGDEQHVAGLAVAVEDLFARFVAPPAAALPDRRQLGRGKRSEQPDLA
jgi:FAD/FMN-containing dehydrogenase